MRLLTLSEYAQNALREGKITTGHAKVLVGLDSKKQNILVDSIIGQKLSVRDVENLVKKEKKSSVKKENKNNSLDLSEVSKALKRKGLKFSIRENRVTIEFRNSEEISNFLDTFLSKSY